VCGVSLTGTPYSEWLAQIDAFHTFNAACLVLDSPFSIVAQVGDFGALSLIATKRCEAFCSLGYKD
jgi:hypothetical protein